MRAWTVSLERYLTGYGETGWMRVNGAAGSVLANDTFISSYDFARERSWEIRHDYDFAALGIPGLTVMNRYLSVENIHTSVTSDGKEWGRESELAYVIQRGPLKNMSFKWRNSSLRRDFSNYDIDENRVIFHSTRVPSIEVRSLPRELK